MQHSYFFNFQILSIFKRQHDYSNESNKIEKEEMSLTHQHQSHRSMIASGRKKSKIYNSIQSEININIHTGILKTKLIHRNKAKKKQRQIKPRVEKNKSFCRGPYTQSL